MPNQYCRYCANAEGYNGDGTDFVCFADILCGDGGSGIFYSATKEESENRCKHYAFCGIDILPCGNISRAFRGRCLPMVIISKQVCFRRCCYAYKLRNKVRGESLFHCNVWKRRGDIGYDFDNGFSVKSNVHKSPLLS